MNEDAKDLLDRWDRVFAVASAVQRAELVHGLVERAHRQADESERGALALVVAAAGEYLDRQTIREEYADASGSIAAPAVVDALLDRAAREQPGVEYTLLTSAAIAELIPSQVTRLFRRDERGRLAYSVAHVYRDRLVAALLPDDAKVVEFVPLRDGSPASLAAVGYVGFIETGVTEIRDT